MSEIFQLACVALLFGKSEKHDGPSPCACIKIRDPRKYGYVYPEMVPLEPHPAQPAGFLPIMFSLSAMLISLLGKDFL